MKAGQGIVGPGRERAGCSHQPSTPAAPAEPSPRGALSLEQIRVAEARARARVEANRPGDRELALRALRQMRTRLENRLLDVPPVMRPAASAPRPPAHAEPRPDLLDRVDAERAVVVELFRPTDTGGKAA